MNQKEQTKTYKSVFKWVDWNMFRFKLDILTLLKLWVSVGEGGECTFKPLSAAIEMSV